jgi:hypothetical protein
MPGAQRRHPLYVNLDVENVVILMSGTLVTGTLIIRHDLYDIVESQHHPAVRVLGAPLPCPPSGCFDLSHAPAGHTLK